MLVYGGYCIQVDFGLRESNAADSVVVSDVLRISNGAIGMAWAVPRAVFAVGLSLPFVDFIWFDESMSLLFSSVHSI